MTPEANHDPKLPAAKPEGKPQGRPEPKQQARPKHPPGTKKNDFLIRHKEPCWAYQHSRISGPAYLNYVYRNGRRTLRLHARIKDRKEQVSIIIPLPLIDRFLDRIKRDGPINHQGKITFEKMRFRHRAPATDEN